MSEQTKSTEQGDIRESLTDVIGGEPSAVYLLSPGISLGKNIDYKSPSMLDPDYLRGKEFGYVGGALRVHAVAYLHKFFPDATVITSTTTEGISHAKVQERELQAIWEKWGIPQPENIIREEKSESTATEMAELIRLIVQNNWKGKIVAITNDYHVSRTKAMLEQLPSLITSDPTFSEVWTKFKERADVNIVVQDAESILRIVSPKFKNMLDVVFMKEPWKSYKEKRIESERRGIKALEEGHYEPQPLRIKSTQN